MYTIKELSDRFALKASTIRYYEEIGLLENVIHKDKYHRIYSEEHIDRLSAIECFKRARLPLQDIKLFFEYEKNIRENSENILKMMELQEERTKKEVEELTSGLLHVQKKIRYYSAVDEAIKQNKKIPDWNEVIKDF